jgi:hypothetical protein
MPPTGTERPFAELIRTFPAHEQGALGAVARVLREMNRDYHDTRGMPCNDLDSYLRESNLSSAHERFVREHLHPVSLTGAELLAKGLSPEGQGAFDGYGNTSVPFPRRRIEFLQQLDLGSRQLLFHFASLCAVELGVNPTVFQL